MLRAMRPTRPQVLARPEPGGVQEPDLDWVLRELQSLAPPTRGPPDPCSKLWPSHVSAGVAAGQQDSPPDGPSEDQLQAHFPEYFKQYGYGG